MNGIIGWWFAGGVIGILLAIALIELLKLMLRI